MKGGKRLTEEARINFVAQLETWGIFTKLRFPIAGADMQLMADFLKRDDEPEYCACGHAHGMHSADIWACDDCGKPVKGE
jgi:hypothetical protein